MEAAVKGLPQGSFLLAYYENEPEIEERCSSACSLRQRCRPMTMWSADGRVLQGQPAHCRGGKPADDFTRYEFGFSGLECRILGTFYRSTDKRVEFGADVENFYSAHNYSVVKPNTAALEVVVNFRDGEASGGPADIEIGRVRYSSSIRFQNTEEAVPVYIDPNDFLGKRTALFGMTRTGKSNTIKKIIEATVAMSKSAPMDPEAALETTTSENNDPYTEQGFPRYPVGQIVFDINGEYANANLQDEGTAIFEMYKDLVTRYSVLKKPGFQVMKINFYRDIIAGFEMIQSGMALETADYAKSFLAIDLTPPEDETDFSAKTRYERKVAAYQCCLHLAQFPAPKGHKVAFTGSKELNDLTNIDPKKGITLDQAVTWFTRVWSEYESNSFFSDYAREKGREWADEDLKALLVFLTRQSRPGRAATISGYRKLRDMIDMHTDTLDEPFQDEIIKSLRQGRIVIVDLSQGDPVIQGIYSERICRGIFQDAMARFIETGRTTFSSSTLRRHTTSSQSVRTRT